MQQMRARRDKKAEHVTPISGRITVMTSLSAAIYTWVHKYVSFVCNWLERECIIVQSKSASDIKKLQAYLKMFFFF